MEDNDMIQPVGWVISDSIIKVVGVGGGGCNAISHMYESGAAGCSFIACNTDSQALSNCKAPVKIQLGPGLGAGTDPSIGRRCAIEAAPVLEEKIFDGQTQMLFITAGMGGGTGTGAAPVIAKMAKERDILTVAVVTLPYSFEGTPFMERAVDGIKELENYVDSMLIINNEKIFQFGKLTLHQAFRKVDEVLNTAVMGIIDIIKKPGHQNVDFQDVKTMMTNSGMALMGHGSGSGENRIDEAIKGAFESPLLNDFDLKTAKNLLINITCSDSEEGLTVEEYDRINERIKEITGGANNFKRGLLLDRGNALGDTIKITAIATGFRVASLLSSGVKQVNIIEVSSDFKFDDTKPFIVPEGIAGSGKRKFHYEERPSLAE